MKHPNQQCQKQQDDFLNQCSASEKEYHSTLFRIGNAAYIYHQSALDTSSEILEIYYTEWLEGLPDNIRKFMKMKGFDECKTTLPFTRYVNEKKDKGMDEWMKEHLSEEDYNFYKNQNEVDKSSLQGNL